MIFAAGMGTRLKPLTDTMPKALVKVGGEPLLKRIILKLSASGFTHIVVNVHHFAEMITTYLAENHNFDTDIQISPEPVLLETGGGIRHAEKLFRPGEPILIHNVDILSNVNLDAFYNQFKGDATLLVSSRQTSRYLLFNSEMRLVGWVNIKTGEVKSPYAEVKQAATNIPALMAGQTAYRAFAFSGIHVFSPRLFSFMQSWPEKFPIIDFYLQVCSKAEIYGYVDSNLHLLDVGKLDTLQQAEEFVEGKH